MEKKIIKAKIEEKIHIKTQKKEKECCRKSEKKIVDKPAIFFLNEWKKKIIEKGEKTVEKNQRKCPKNLENKSEEN